MSVIAQQRMRRVKGLYNTSYVMPRSCRCVAQNDGLIFTDQVTKTPFVLDMNIVGVHTTARACRVESTRAKPAYREHNVHGDCLLTEQVFWEAVSIPGCVSYSWTHWRRRHLFQPKYR